MNEITSKKCPNCFQEFSKRKETRIGRFLKQVYCSNKCWNSVKKSLKLKRNCLVCSKEFFTSKSQNKKLCSTKCHGEFLRKELKGKQCPLSRWSTKNQHKIRGELSHNWKGGVTTLNRAIFKSKEYSEWRTSVFIRDLFKCRMPLCVAEGKVQAHHIKTFSNLLNESKAKTLEEVRNFQPMWDIRNGITLCPPCHSKVTWKEEQFADLFNNIVRNSV